MICDCDGLLSVKSVEEYQEEIKDKIKYNRVCHVECLSCGKVIYSQPYDYSKKINLKEANMGYLISKKKAIKPSSLIFDLEII